MRAHFRVDDSEEGRIRPTRPGMKCTLIRCPQTFHAYVSAAPAVPPIGLAYVAASLRRAGHDVQIIDATGERIDRLVPIDHSGRFLRRGLTDEEILDRIARCRRHRLQPDVLAGLARDAGLIAKVRDASSHAHPDRGRRALHRRARRRPGKSRPRLRSGRRGRSSRLRPDGAPPGQATHRRDRGRVFPGWARDPHELLGRLASETSIPCLAGLGPGPDSRTTLPMDTAGASIAVGTCR